MWKSSSRSLLRLHPLSRGLSLAFDGQSADGPGCTANGGSSDTVIKSPKRRWQGGEAVFARLQTAFRATETVTDPEANRRKRAQLWQACMFSLRTLALIASAVQIFTPAPIA